MDIILIVVMNRKCSKIKVVIPIDDFLEDASRTKLICSQLVEKVHLQVGSGMA